MSIVIKRGRRGCTVFCLDPSGTIGTKHFPGIVDILGRGSQTVLPPTRHPDTGLLYHWTTDATLLDTSIATLPVIAPDIADRLTTALAPWIDNAPDPAPPRVPLQRCELSENERERQHHYAETILARELAALSAMASNSGRNQAAFRLVCRIGRWVHAGILSVDRLTAGVLEACRLNGLVSEDGARAISATIASALRKSANDPLPDLRPGRHRHG